MTVTVRYFAKLKEESGTAVEVIETDARTVRDLWGELVGKHPFTLGPSLVLVAQAEEFCDWDAELKVGQEVAFMPPVSGG